MIFAVLKLWLICRYVALTQYYKLWSFLHWCIQSTVGAVVVVSHCTHCTICICYTCALCVFMYWDLAINLL